MIDEWGKPTPPLESTERNEALNRLEAYRRAGFLLITRSESYKVAGAVLMAGVQMPEQELTRYWVNRESVHQAFKTGNDSGAHAPGITLWLADGNSLSEAHNQNPSDEGKRSINRVIPSADELV